jgi:hypothetical protein
MNFIDLASPPKKGLGVAYESDEPLDTTPTTTLVFNPGYSEKNLAKAIYKVARKGKNKLVSVSLASELDSENKGALSSHPSSNENIIMELQGAFQAYCSSNSEKVNQGSIS